MRALPRPPARAVSVAALVVLLAGTSMLVYVGYLLFGTGLQQESTQERLKVQFNADLANPGTPSPSPSPSPSLRSTSAKPRTLPRAPEGHVVALLRIPRLGAHYEQAVVEGVRLRDLEKGPGHYSTTPFFGEPGNVGVAGHRTTWGAPFFHLDQLRRGDRIDVRTAAGDFGYRVIGREIVTPTQTSVLRPDPTAPIAQPGDGRGNYLTLTTCNPVYSARQRLVVHAVQTSFTPIESQSQ